jgi:hypothetical protein
MSRHLLAIALLATGCASADPAGQDPGNSNEEVVAARPFVIELGHDPTGLPSWSTAYATASLSRLSYSSPDEIRAGLAGMGVPGSLTVFANSSTAAQGYLVDSPQWIVLVFRGTQELDDVLTDLDVVRTTTAYGEVHAGFERAFRSVWNDNVAELTIGGEAPGVGLATMLRKRLSAVAGARPELLLTGHSLGGALATLAAVNLAYDCAGETVLSDAQLASCGGSPLAIHSVYTYGSPRVGDARFAALAGRLADPAHVRHMFRFTHGVDAVPSTPAAAFGFSHPIDGSPDESKLEIHLESLEPSHFPLVDDHLTAGYIAAIVRRLDGTIPPTQIR